MYPVKKKISRLARAMKRLPARDKFLVIEATVLTGLFRFLILFIPFRKLAAKMGALMKESTESISIEQSEKAKSIAKIVIRVARNTPWESMCLVQALTTQTILHSQSISSTLYLGIAKKEGKLIAHAWLRSGTDILTGGDVMNDFKCIAYFGVLLS